MSTYRIEGTTDVYPSSLDLFDRGDSEVGIVREYYVEQKPIAPITDYGPIEFQISENSQHHINFQKSNFYIRFRILDKNNQPIKATHNVAPVNAVLNSLFQQIEVQFSDRVVSNGETTHHITSYLTDLLGTSLESKKSFMEASGYYRDDVLSTTNPKAGNRGLVSRYSLVKNGKYAEFIGKLNVDCLNLDKLMLPGTRVSIKLWQSNAAFFLMSNDPNPEYHIDIKTAIYKVCKVVVQKELFLQHERALNDGKLSVYPFTRHHLKVNLISVGSSSFQFSNLFGFDVPKVIICGLLKSAALIGAYDENPFLFLPYNLTKLRIQVDGEDTPQPPLELSFGRDDEKWVTAYHNMFSELGIQDYGTGVNRKIFLEGYALYVFRLVPDIEGDNSFAIIRKGGVEVSGLFSVPTTENLSLIVFGIFDTYFEVDAPRNIFM
jgi:hypothetical protein